METSFLSIYPIIKHFVTHYFRFFAFLVFLSQKGMNLSKNDKNILTFDLLGSIIQLERQKTALGKETRI